MPHLDRGTASFSHAQTHQQICISALNFLDAIQLACKQCCAHLDDVNRMHSEWSFLESHHLLKSLVWHHHQPFRQKILILRYFDRIKKTVLKMNFLNYIDDEILS